MVVAVVAETQSFPNLPLKTYPLKVERLVISITAPSRGGGACWGLATELWNLLLFIIAVAVITFSLTLFTRTASRQTSEDSGPFKISLPRELHF